MKRIRILAAICTLLLLAGCATPAAPVDTTAPSETTAPTDGETVATEPEATLPAAQRVEHLDLPPLPEIAPEDRCAATGMGKLVETENGYYMTPDGVLLYYADKSNLTDWVAVCNQPGCKHDKTPLESRRAGKPECHAYLNRGIWRSDGKIYTLSLYEESTTDVILSSPGDGSAWTTVFSDENSPFHCEGGIAWGAEFYPDGLCMNVVQMKPNGYWDCYLYFVDKNGAHKYIYAEDFPDMIWPSGGNVPYQIRGDMVKPLIKEYPGPNADTDALAVLHRVSPEAIEKLDFPEGCDCYGAYLSGDTMIHYHPGDGFYRLDYSGGMEEKIADAAYQDSFGYCLDGKFLVETTVAYESTAKECKLRYFDGTDWTEVPLPEDFTPETNLRIVALSSDTLFLKVSQAGITQLYMISLGDNQLTKCADFSNPIGS